MYYLISLFVTSLVMSVFIFIVLILRKFIPRIFSAGVRYFIWSVILLGLIIPFRPMVGSGIIHVSIPNLQEGNLVIDNKLSDSVRAITAASENIFNNINIYMIIWSVIAIFKLLFYIFRYIRFTKAIKRWGINVTDEAILSVLREVQYELKLTKKHVNLKKCELVSVSMLTGFLHPVIILPNNDYDKDELKLIFKHELLHLKRYDLFIKLLSVFAMCLHWFNPLVYKMCNVMMIDCEILCDEEVLRDKDIESRRFYGEIILGMIGNKHELRTEFSTCFYTGKSNIKKRLDSIMEMRKRTNIFLVICAIIITTTLTLFSGSVFAFSNVNTLYKNDLSSSYKFSEISSSKAKELALSTVGGGVVLQCELDFEDGRRIYEIEIKYKNKIHEIDIDAGNSEIVNYEIDDD